MNFCLLTASYCKFSISFISMEKWRQVYCLLMFVPLRISSTRFHRNFNDIGIDCQVLYWRDWQDDWLYCDLIINSTNLLWFWSKLAFTQNRYLYYPVPLRLNHTLVWVWPKFAGYVAVVNSSSRKAYHAGSYKNYRPSLSNLETLSLLFSNRHEIGS